MRYVLAAFLTSCVLGVPAFAQNNAVKIGVLDDMSASMPTIPARATSSR